MASMMSILLEIARRVLQTVIEQVANQIRVVEADVKDFLEQLLTQIVGGAWEGDAANEYVGNIRRNLIPKIMEVINAVTSINQSIVTAKDIIETADKNVATKVNDLGNTYKNIYR